VPNPSDAGSLVPAVVASDPVMVRAVAAIRSGKVTQRADGHLVLPPGTHWPSTTTNVLFVRSCYAPLYESVLGRCLFPLDEFPAARNARRIMTGHPGIGNTAFG